MGFSRQKYWIRLPFPSPEDLPDPGIKPRSPALQADALPSEPPGGKYSQFSTLCKIDSQWEPAVWHSSGLCDNRDGWDEAGGSREVQEGGDTHTHIADSLHCTAETNTKL